MPDLDRQLLETAREALQKAYAPYSGFRVGAAVLTKTGRMFSGCNVENSSYGLTVCAERIALFKAVSEGEKEFSSLALVTEGKKPVTPCGACRQVLAEFAPSLRILLCTPDGVCETTTLTELLPNAFGRENLAR
jgi:cytidine deaminase